MLDLDFTPDNIALAFNPYNSLFATIGNYGSCVNVWDTVKFSLQLNLPVKGFIIKELAFAPDTGELIVVTTDSRVRFYSI